MNEDLRELLHAIDGDARYPAGFSERYTILECLAERPGADTFLVQDRNGTRLIAKCCDKAVWAVSGAALLSSLSHPGLPRFRETLESGAMLVTVREYIPGTPLDRYARENDLTEGQITDLCMRLCDILTYLHTRPEPVIHRDLKPENVIVRPDGGVTLIDFDIARLYSGGQDTDTVFFGTRAYAPPEQYGFAQTDARADIYSLGILLRYLLTGSPRANRNVRLRRPLARIIDKCTAFSPKERFADAAQVKRALRRSEPRARALIMAASVLGVLAAAALLVLAGTRIYRAVTYTPFTADAIPGYLSDEERIADAAAFLRERYGTALFDDTDAPASVGLLRQAITELYGLDRDYVWGMNTGIPAESEDFFLPWGWDDAQNLDREPAIYAAVKVHDPALVADWSGLPDDNGYYPGMRVAAAFAEETGIGTGVNRPLDITAGELALILANADRVFDAAAGG